MSKISTPLGPTVPENKLARKQARKLPQLSKARNRKRAGGQRKAIRVSTTKQTQPTSFFFSKKHRSISRHKDPCIPTIPSIPLPLTSTSPPPTHHLPNYIAPISSTNNRNRPPLPLPIPIQWNGHRPQPSAHKHAHQTPNQLIPPLPTHL